MTIRVSPTEPNPTHHIKLKDRDGKELGLILCDSQGNVATNPFNKTPLDTTANKQTSGASSYDIFDYPYSPIVQDDFSGGRGSQDFERDATKYFDGFRADASRANKVIMGPQDHFATGIRSLDQSVPGSVSWHILTGSARYLYKRIQAGSSFTAALYWLLVRTVGDPADLTIAIYSDSGSGPNTLLESTTVDASARLDDVLSEWLCETISEGLTSGTYYWLVIYASAEDGSANHWKIAINANSGTTYYSESYTASPTAATFDLYYRLTDADADQTCVPFQYKEAQYFVISGASGAPSLFIAGDRGTADSNTGELSKLKDATKSWTVNQWAGATVEAIDETTGRSEYRTVVSNAASELVVDTDWEITHTTSTIYIIHADVLTEITGHGLTAPVTDVLVSSKHVIYFAMGNQVTVRQAKFENSSGDWTASYTDETATTKADFLAYMPVAKKIVLLSNYDASGNVSLQVMSNASLPDYATVLTWAAAINVDSKYRHIAGTEIYPNDAGEERIWIFKEDGIWTHDALTGDPEKVSLKEFENVRSEYAGKGVIHHNVYLYFSLQHGLERYYGAQFDDVGPNRGEGLPDNRRGPIVDLIGYPGKYFVAINAGASGYSSVLSSDGWHERYRAPLGQEIKALSFQVIPGTAPDRMWIFQGNDLVWIPFPSETANPLEDTNYTYTHECAITLSRMHAGMFDVQKLVKLVKLQTDNLTASATNQPITWFELDYRLGGDTAWTPFEDLFTESPLQGIDLTDQYGLADKRLQLRIRGYTTDSSVSPILLAIIVSAVIRTDVKYMYQLQFRLMDREPLLSRNEEDSLEADTKLEQIETWADASSDSMLMMNSISPLFDDKMIFLNPPQTRQIRMKDDQGNTLDRIAYILTATAQEA